MTDEQVYDEGESYVEDDVELTDYDPEQLDVLQQAVDQVNALPPIAQKLASVGLIEVLGGEAI